MDANSLSGPLPTDLGQLFSLKFLYVGFFTSFVEISAVVFRMLLSYLYGFLSLVCCRHGFYFLAIRIHFTGSRYGAASSPPPVHNLLRVVASEALSLVFLYCFAVNCSNVSNNALSGSLPASISNLGITQYFYAAHNQFSGSLPAGIGKMNSLQAM